MAEDSQIALLSFRLNTQHYGLRIEYVVEVAAMVKLEVLPDAPPALLGLANRHGNILPILDLRNAFKQGLSPMTVSTLFIVAEYRGRKLGLVVDEIYQVIYLSQEAIKAAGTGRFISHLFSIDNKVYQEIDLKALLAAYLAETPI